MAAPNPFRPGDIVWADRPPPRHGKGPWVVTSGYVPGITVTVGNKVSYLLRRFRDDTPLEALAWAAEDTGKCFVRMSARNQLRKLSPLEMLALSS